jgi:hypothetical protein
MLRGFYSRTCYGAIPAFFAGRSNLKKLLYSIERDSSPGLSGQGQDFVQSDTTFLDSLGFFLKYEQPITSPLSGMIFFQ